VFVFYAMFSSGAHRDLHGYRGILKKYCPAFQALNSEWLPLDLTAVGEVFFGIPEFAPLPQI
jgi:hypothetical protein